MTSEYDELLAQPEDLDALADIWQAAPGIDNALSGSIRKAAAAIRALTAQVVERDAVIEKIAEWEQNPRSTYGELGQLLVTHFHAKKDGSADALAARDAVRDKTVRATALRDAADDFAEREGVEATMFANDNVEAVRATEAWLRSRADQEEPMTTNGDPA